MKNTILVLLATLFADGNAFHNASNCTEEFHMILEKAADIKSHCSMRGFYDCCEVSHIVSEYHVCHILTILYVIIQAQAAGKLAHFDSSASGVYMT